MSAMTAQLPSGNPDPGPDPRVHKWIPAKSLVCDQRYQREIDPEKKARIAHDLDWARFESVSVVDNGDGTYNVFEGQHRTLAAQEVNPEFLISCMVLPGRTDGPRQAQLALDIVKGRSSHSAYEQWCLRFNAGHPHEVLATRVLNRHNVRLGRCPSSTTIGAVATVKKIIHGGNYTPEYGADLLDLVLAVLMAAFPTYDRESNVSRWDHNLIFCVSSILHNNGHADLTLLARMLQVRPAIQWVNFGKQRDEKASWQTMYDALISAYNKGKRKGRLS